ncbi:MAG: NAD(P)H-binding protein [Cryomorphaceae bacterium]|nr:NAD(P)H-binding protein [Cryomorphaceae bacterium]
MSNKRKALLVGGTGLVGSHLLKFLIENDAYDEVRVMGRTQPDLKNTKITFIETDLVNRAFPRSAFVDVHDVFCAVGTTQKLTPNKEAYKAIDIGIPSGIAEASSIFNARNFLVVSSIGASDQSRFFYLRVKGEMEEKVIVSGVPTIEIFRPNTLLGKRKVFRFGEWIAKVFNHLTSWFMPKKYQAIKASDVAKAMIVRALDNPDPGVNVWESDQIMTLAKEYK